MAVSKTNRTAARKAKATTKPARTETQDDEERFKREHADFARRCGRNYAVGKVGKSGTLLYWYMNELTLDEAEAVIKGTDLEILPMTFVLQPENRRKQRDSTRALWRKREDYQTAQRNKRWKNPHKSMDGVMPKNRQFEVWFVVHKGGRLDGQMHAVTTNVDAVGNAIESLARMGMEAIAFRVPVTVPTVPTMPLEFTTSGKVRKVKLPRVAPPVATPGKATQKVYGVVRGGELKMVSNHRSDAKAYAGGFNLSKGGRIPAAKVITGEATFPK